MAFLWWKSCTPYYILLHEFCNMSDYLICHIQRLGVVNIKKLSISENTFELCICVFQCADDSLVLHDFQSFVTVDAWLDSDIGA